jgi:hypothetical protein
VPDLIAILSNAANSMGAQRALSATAAHNIQNVNTAGYSRQRAEIAATLPADSLGGVFIGRGAYLAGVAQVRDRFLEAQVPRALGEAARSAAEAEALSSVHVLDPERAGSLASALGGFYGALRALSQNPGEEGLRAAALGAARTLATSFERTSAGLQSARAGIDARVESLLLEVNASARAVAEANATLQRTGGMGGAPNDLLDLRCGSGTSTGSRSSPGRRRCRRATARSSSPCPAAARWSPAPARGPSPPSRIRRTAASSACASRRSTAPTRHSRRRRSAAPSAARSPPATARSGRRSRRSTRSRPRSPAT